MSSYEDELILQTQINYENYFIAEVLPKLLVDYDEDITEEKCKSRIDEYNQIGNTKSTLKLNNRLLMKLNLVRKHIISRNVFLILINLRLINLVRSEIFMRDEILELKWDFNLFTCYRDTRPNLFVYPEFLTERSAKYDFFNQSRFILGGDKHNTEKVANLFRWRFGD